MDINEADISKIGLGSPANVIPDSYPDRTFAASVVKVYPAADRQKGTIKVEVHLDNPDLQVIKPEMSAKVSFLESTRAENVEPPITVPQSAVKVDGVRTTFGPFGMGLLTRKELPVEREPNLVFRSSTD